MIWLTYIRIWKLHENNTIVDTSWTNQSNIGVAKKPSVITLNEIWLIITIHDPENKGKSTYFVLFQNFIIWDNFVNILSIPANGHHTIISTYASHLINKSKNLDNEMIILHESTIYHHRNIEL